MLKLLRKGITGESPTSATCCGRTPAPAAASPAALLCQPAAANAGEALPAAAAPGSGTNPSPPRVLRGPRSPGRDLPVRGSAGAATPGGRSETGGCRGGGGRSPAAPLGEVQASPPGAGFLFSLVVVFFFSFLSSFKPPPPALGAEPSSGGLQFAV